MPKLPLNYDDAKDFFEDGVRVTTKDVEQYKLTNVFVGATGVIYTPFQVLSESIVDEKHHGNYSPKAAVKDFLKGRIKLLPNENYLHVFDHWSANNHYHFHADLLPKLTLFTPQELAGLVLLLPDSFYSRKVAPELLKLFNFKPKAIEYIHYRDSNRGKVFVRNCLFIPKLTESHENHTILIEKLKQTLQPAQEENSPKRVYLKREDTSFRILLNAKEVESVLESFGFTPVPFDNLPLKDQIRTVANADILLGMHGAGLTNVLYMRKDSHLVEFRRDGKHFGHLYWHMASAAGVNYSAVFGEPDNPNLALEGIGCNLSLDVEHLKRVLERICK
ncbi:glycosyltransferase family 61 protein [Flavisolibacter ginsenosidimutans]